MPLTIPEFVQYQGVMIPLRGLWNTQAPEGDRFVNVEVDWGSPGLLGVNCVQFAISGNSPVQFSQIVALSVDNSRCGSDVDFIFPDSGFVLTVPAFNQGVYPIFSNALMFYANAPGAGAGDITIAQVLNSMPPPVAIQPSAEQQHAGGSGLQLNANASFPVIPAGTNGTINGFSISVATPSTATGTCFLNLTDGTGKPLWGVIIDAPTSATWNLAGLDLRFQNGVNLVVSGTDISAGTVNANLYYSVP